MDLQSVYNNKKQYIQRRKRKNGTVAEKLVEGFNETTFLQFQEWYNQEVFDRGCVYCGLTNQESARLYELQRTGVRMDGTRGGKRGKRLELDRQDPNQPYDNLRNLVWCCYWCNNAKSNFFTVEEFLPIAQVMGRVLRNIINNNEHISN